MIKNFKNTIDFTIRNNTKFTRKNYTEKNDEIIRYTLKENNYVIAILEKYFTKNNKDKLRILDIGCKNWSYAKGEHNYFNSFSGDFILDGVEIDPHRLYLNLYSRQEVAKYHIKNLSNTNYIPANLLDINTKYDYIIWLLPFIFKKSLLYWGLPAKLFCPDRLLSHAYNLLNQKGQMLIVNQGEKEAEKQEELLKIQNIPYEFIGEIENEYLSFQNKRFGFIIKKD